MTQRTLSKQRGHASQKAVRLTVPKGRLYVERPGKQEEKWFVNVGHVTDRGRWRTEPHAHPGYGQVIFVRNGRGLMNLEGRNMAFEGPCALLLPTECVHGLDYESDVDKWVVTIEVSYLAHINAKLRELSQLWALPRIIPLSGEPAVASELHALIQRLEHEVKIKTVGHVVGTEALVTLLVLVLVRGARLDETGSTASAGPTDRFRDLLADRFRDLVEQHYCENLRLRDYASMLAVSPTQLRAACAATTDLSPNKIIRARIITEAKRNLIFGDMAIEQIAYGLGFVDAAYFTRFFRKEVGQSPSLFRLAARQPSDLAK